MSTVTQHDALVRETAKNARYLAVGDYIFHALNGWEKVAKVETSPSGVVLVWTGDNEHAELPSLMVGPNDVVATLDLPVLNRTTSRPLYGGYRLYTNQHVSFDDVLPYGLGGPSTVVNKGWGKSTSTLDPVLSSPSVVAADDGKVELHVYAVPHVNGVEDHPLHNTRWDTRRDADRAAFEAGITAFMVYEDHAERQGFGVNR